MEAMTMAFRVEDPTQIAELKPGDKVEFEFVYQGQRSFVRNVRKLPPETVLTLAE
jgi:Cu/Ag efflux protein CusF